MEGPPPTIPVSQPRLPWGACLAWMGVAFALRLFVLLSFKEHPLFAFPLVDGRFYQNWAAQMAVEGPFSGAPFTMSPLYAWFLLLFSRFDIFVLRVVLVLIGAGTVGMLSVTAWYAGGKRALHLTGLLSAFALPLAMADLNLMKTGLGVFLFSAALCHLAANLAAPETRRPVSWLTCGLLFGLAALVREPLLGVAFLAAGLALIFLRNKKPLLAVGLFVLGVLALPTISGVGQYAQARHFVLLTAAGGEALWIGLGPEADGTFKPPPFARPDPAVQHTDFHQEARRRAKQPLSAKEANTWWTREALSYALRHPGQTAALMLTKCRLLLSSRDVPSDLSLAAWQTEAPWVRLFFCSWWLILPLGLAGMTVTSRQTNTKWLLMALLALGVALLLPFFIYDRFRLFALLPLFPLAGLCADAAWTTHKKWAPLAVAVFAAIWMTVDRDWVKAEPRPGYDARLLGDLAYQAKDFEQAERHYKKALKDPHFGKEAGLNLGAMALSRGKLNQARGYLQQVLKRDPGNPEALGNLAMVYTQSGKDKEALALFQEALARDPDNPGLWENFGAFFWKLKRYAAARAAMEKALALQPPFTGQDLLLKLVFLSIKAREEEKAREFAKQLEAFSPAMAENAEAQINKAFGPGH